jgi:adaptin ear-binding coat-associated protein 1/2
MTSIDHSTGSPLPADAIQRVLFVASGVHVYKIPPITSTSGFNAAQWTQNPRDHIFTCRVRVIETAIPSPSSNDPEKEKVSTAVLLEDSTSGELFAACPYANPAAVERANDSSRFFAVRVVGEGGMKATLGIGFEDRAESLDFSIALQDARKLLGFDQPSTAAGARPGRRQAPPAPAPEKKDFSLKEGEMITVNIGGKSRKTTSGTSTTSQSNDTDALFSIKPPPSGGAIPFLPPPPSASSVKKERRRSREPPKQDHQSTQDLGFDDGEFGEFQ